MTTANKVTIMRILLIPFFVMEVIYYMKTGKEMHRLFAFLAFAVASICDGVDGYIARRFNQRSELGAILDPLGDKLLLVSAIILFCFESDHFGSIPLWLTGTIIGRDILLLIGWVVIQITVGKVKVQPRFLGKMATVLQMICVIWILLKWDRIVGGPWFSIWTIGAGVCTGLSGVLYVYDGIAQLSSHPTSSAAPTQGGDR